MILSVDPGVFPEKDKKKSNFGFPHFQIPVLFLPGAQKSFVSRASWWET